MKKLGFGLMRMPMQGDDVSRPSKDQRAFDWDKCNELVDVFLANGFRHFDTAWIYASGRSEEMFRRCVSERHPRDKYVVSTKLPVWQLKSNEDCDIFLKKQLQNCGVDYIDYYLLHSLNKDSFENCKRFDCFDWGYKKQSEGLIKKFGFSFHDNADVLEEILGQYKVDFVMLQINYADWDDATVQSRLCYQVAVKYGLEVIVMEPLKGGQLVNLPQEAIDVLKSANPDASVPSWAMRFVGQLENVSIVLSGMNDLEQLYDNMKHLDDVVCLDGNEMDVIKMALDVVNSKTIIKCTMCDYCLPICPKGLPISEYFNLYNDYFRGKGKGWSVQCQYYDSLSGKLGGAGECIGCGECEKICPQKLEIIRLLGKVKEVFE
jgi:predicted aldo/keto reductase-like oxidoreductase